MVLHTIQKGSMVDRWGREEGPSNRKGQTPDLQVLYTSSKPVRSRMLPQSRLPSLCQESRYYHLWKLGSMWQHVQRWCQVYRVPFSVTYCMQFIHSFITLHYMYVKYKYIGMNEMAFETRDHNERSCFYNNIELSWDVHMHSTTTRSVTWPVTRFPMTVMKGLFLGNWRLPTYSRYSALLYHW